MAGSWSGGRRRSATRSRARRGRPASPATGRCAVSTTDSVWSFELGQRAAEIAGRLGFRRSFRARAASRAAGRTRQPLPPAAGPRRRTSQSSPRSDGLDRRRGAPRKCAESGQFAPRQRALRPPRLIHFSTLQNYGFAGISSYGEDNCEGRLLGQGHHRARRSRGVRLRPGMYIGSTGSRGLSPLSSTRSWTTLSTRPWRATTTRSM